MDDSSTDCKDIIMEYLLHYCYKDTAKALLGEMKRLDECSKRLTVCASHQDSKPANAANSSKRKTEISLLNAKVEIEWSQIDARREIHSAIGQGDINKAFALIEKHFSSLLRTYDTINRTENVINDKSKLPKSHYTIYKLRCQQFVETLRTQGAIEAIQFAKMHFRPHPKLYAELTNDVTVLIAYTDVANHDRSGQHHRDSIADEVNEMILEFQHFSPQTTLEKLWRQKTAIQVELDIQKRNESSHSQQDSENTKMHM
ncbi:CTLH/CRA C-terminal to lish motif domain-containing protein [Parasitella parasitica]|nr:CTLH/CRA C-terminal to lish motif domain-containing protein [Parasitella parasitica]